jgi:hypothetical protein
MTTRPGTRRERPIAYFAWSGFLLFFCAAWDRLLLHGDKDLWDARVYARALATWKAGGDPYTFKGVGLPFVYPPAFLYGERGLGVLLHGHAAWLVYLALLVAATLAIPWLLARVYLRSAWLTPIVALIVFIFQPRLIGEIVLLSGNLGTLLYALALAAGAVGLRRDRWLPFYVAVVLAGMIKPPFLTLMFLPLLAARRQYWQSAVAAAVAGASYLL